MVSTPLEQEITTKNMETSGIVKQSPHQQGTSEILPTENENGESAEDGLWESAVKIFSPCVGVVDFASIFIQNCRTQSTEDMKKGVDGQPVLKMKLRRPAQQQSRRRQGETLEFPVNGGFDDDVSAISAHTLEEMERFEKLSKDMGLLPPLAIPGPSYSKKSTKPDNNGQILSPGVKVRDFGDWAYPVRRTNSNTSVSLGVSTSGSASSAEDEKATPQPGGMNQGSKRRYGLGTASKSKRIEC